MGEPRDWKISEFTCDEMYKFESIHLRVKQLTEAKISEMIKD